MSTLKGRADPGHRHHFPEAIADAHRHLEASGQVGKIGVTVPHWYDNADMPQGCPTRW
ncbi:hypothetical protein [Streptomyces sp. NPDC051286]|uniref:hypothetical protein n=1 Tax=Streptomyces sp. NPDC051286 TaxID=3365647 RepID=UPI0037A80D56